MKPKTTQNSRSRVRAFTLAELMAVLALMAVFVPVALGTLVAALELHTRHEERTRTGQSVDRLFTQFREDVHRYGNPRIEQDETTLASWELPDGNLRYVFVEGKFTGQQILVRQQDVNEGNPILERYTLPERSLLWCYSGKDAHENRLALSLWREIEHTPKPKREDLNPFTRDISEKLSKQVAPAYAENWRTAVICVQD